MKELTRIVTIEITGICKERDDIEFISRDECRASTEMFCRNNIDCIDDLHVTVQDFEMEVDA